MKSFFFLNSASKAINLHVNMFSIYVALTKGQQYPFKKFLSEVFLTIFFVSCLHLYRWLKEAGDDEMC